LVEARTWTCISDGRGVTNCCSTFDSMGVILESVMICLNDNEFLDPLLKLEWCALMGGGGNVEVLDSVKALLSLLLGVSAESSVTCKLSTSSSTTAAVESLAVLSMFRSAAAPAADVFSSEDDNTTSKTTPG